MARGELLRKLFLSQRRGNEEEFRAAALQVIAEEEQKQNHQLARDLSRILESSNGSLKPGATLASLPLDRERQTLLVEVREPRRSLNDIILRREDRLAIERIIEEYRKSEILRVHALRPNTKLLFAGPPGCGKTLCAEVIATELGMPLLYTRFDAIVSSYLGETAANLRKVFDYAAAGRWVVLFDEFDAIGKERDDPSEHGELKRVISSFLQILDGFEAPSLLIATTNHEQLLDTALWRRFDEIIYFPPPTLSGVVDLLEMKLRNFPTRLNLRENAKRLGHMSFAEVERVCIDAIKLALLRQNDVLKQLTFDEAVRRERQRLALIRRALKRRRS